MGHPLFEKNSDYFIKNNDTYSYSPQIQPHIEGDWLKSYNEHKHRYRLDIIKNTTKNEDGMTVCVVMKNPAFAGMQESDYSVSFMMEGIFGDENSLLHEKFKILKTSNMNKIIFVNLYSKYQQKDFEGANDTCQASEECNRVIVQESLSEADKIVFALNADIGNDGNFQNKYKEFLTLACGISKPVYETNMHPSATGCKNSDNYGHYDNFKIKTIT